MDSWIGPWSGIWVTCLVYKRVLTRRLQCFSSVFKRLFLSRAIILHQDKLSRICLAPEEVNFLRFVHKWLLLDDILHGFLCREDYNPFNHMDRVITIQYKLPPEADSSLDEETMLNQHEEEALRKCSEAESMVNAKAHFCFKKIMEVCVDLCLQFFLEGWSICQDFKPVQ